MNILITGSTGFIGRHLVRRLADTKDNIFCLVRNENKVKRYLPSNINLIYQDIRDYKGLEREISMPIDTIFHCAGYVSNKNKKKLEEINVLGTQNICKLALKLRVNKLVYLSSVAVISANTEVPLKEDLNYKASNIYGESKIRAERVVLDYRGKGLKVAILRPSMVYGEDEPHLLRLLLLLLKLRLYPILGSGSNKFHLVYVESVVDSMVYAAEEDSFTEEPVFIADREVLTHREVVGIMAQAIGAKSPIRLPSFIIPAAVNVPFFGANIKMLLKDRWFSIEELLSTGFKYNYTAKDSISSSSRDMVVKKRV